MTSEERQAQPHRRSPHLGIVVLGLDLTLTIVASGWFDRLHDVFFLLIFTAAVTVGSITFSVTGWVRPSKAFLGAGILGLIGAALLLYTKMLGHFH